MYGVRGQNRAKQLRFDPRLNYGLESEFGQLKVLGLHMQRAVPRLATTFTGDINLQQLLISRAVKLTVVHGELWLLESVLEF